MATAVMFNLPHHDTIPLTIWVLIATVVIHLSLFLVRGWLIEKNRKQCKALEERMIQWEKEQEARFEDFRDTHLSPWEIIKRKNG